MSDVLVIGAGPSGLTTASELAARGYGARDLHRVLSGPAYARRLVDRALQAGARIDVRATATGLMPLASGGAEVEITSPSGRETTTSRAVILATGCRERPRSARLVPGSRPAGVMTTGWLQRLVHLDHGTPGRRAVVVGAEHVSYSAVVTLADAGCRTVAMVTDAPAHTSFSAFDIAARTRYRFPLLTRTRISAIHGTDRVTGVTVEHDDGRRAHLACDTVIFTGDWYPENELAVRAGLARDPRTHGPSVDQVLRAREPGVLAAGNVLHPASTADVCADDGRRAAAACHDWLSSGRWPAERVPLQVEAPLAWSSPDTVVPGVQGPIRLQTLEALDRPMLSMTQGNRTLWSGRLPYIRPTRPFAIPGRGLVAASADEPIVIRAS